MIRVYFARKHSPFWGDVLTTVQRVYERQNYPFHNMLIDVGLSSIIRKHNRIFYTRTFLEHYRRVVAEMDRRYPRHVRALIPDVPPSWGHHKTHDWFHRHLRLLKEWRQYREEYWIPIVHYFTLDEDEIERMLDENGDVFGEREIIAVPTRKFLTYRQKFTVLMQLLHRKFPSTKIHLLAFFPRDYDFPKQNVVSVDMGASLVNFHNVKRDLAFYWRMRDNERRIFLNFRTSPLGLRLCYHMFLKALIEHYSTVFGGVEYAGWYKIAETHDRRNAGSGLRRPRSGVTGIELSRP